MGIMLKKDRVKMATWRRTKIIATIGPASASEKMLTKLMQVGVDVFRLNMSHGDHASHELIFTRIRLLAEQQNKHIAILMDLCGPKIRVGEFDQGQITLKQNAMVTVSCERLTGNRNIIPSQYRRLYKDVKAGERVLLDDGRIELKVIRIDDKKVTCRVVYGGILRDHKGMNLPDSNVSISSFTAKDKADVMLAMTLGADFVALSFVRQGKDVRTLKKFMKKNGHEIPVISKIEKPEAVINIDEIIANSYGIMVARGDLGIELAAEKVPLIQRELIDLARSRHRPVIVATQMMESMINSARPTRAEVGDVANAALSSADEVMLSAETATVRYPYRTVKVMDTVLRETEQHQWTVNRFVVNNIDELCQSANKSSRPSARKAIAHAACSLVDELKLSALLVPTRNGVTANMVSSVRPSAPLLGLSSSTVTCRKLSLHWGVVPFVIDEIEARDWKKMVSKICQQCLLARKGHKVLLVSGFHSNPGISEPVLKIMTV